MFVVGMGTKMNSRTAGDTSAEARAGVLRITVAGATRSVVGFVDARAEVHGRAAGDAGAETCSGVGLAVAAASTAADAI